MALVPEAILEKLEPMIYTSLISVCGFSYGLAMKTALRLTIFIAVTTLTSGQDTLSCGTDNLSCPRSDPDSQSLQCIAVSQLCDGSSLCSGGQDEGDNLSTIDCEYSLYYFRLMCLTLLALAM